MSATSAPGVFRGIGQRLRLIPADIAHAQELKDLEERLAVMAEGHRAVVGEALLDQHMAVEAAHLVDGEDADAAEARRRHRQDLAFRDVGAEDRRIPLSRVCRTFPYLSDARNLRRQAERLFPRESSEQGFLRDFSLIFLLDIVIFTYSQYFIGV